MPIAQLISSYWKTMFLGQIKQKIAGRKPIAEKGIELAKRSTKTLMSDLIHEFAYNPTRSPDTITLTMIIQRHENDRIFLFFFFFFNTCIECWDRSDLIEPAGWREGTLPPKFIAEFLQPPGVDQPPRTLAEVHPIVLPQSSTSIFTADRASHWSSFVDSTTCNCLDFTRRLAALSAEACVVLKLFFEMIVLDIILQGNSYFPVIVVNLRDVGDRPRGDWDWNWDWSKNDGGTVAVGETHLSLLRIQSSRFRRGSASRKYETWVK